MEVLVKHNRWVASLGVVSLILSIIVFVATKYSLQNIERDLLIQHELILNDIKALTLAVSTESKIVQDTSADILKTKMLLERVVSELNSINDTFQKLQSYYDSQELLIAKLIMNINKKIPKETAFSIANAILKASNRFEVPIPYLVSVMWTESHFNIKSKSSSDCIGLMQINYKVWNKIVPGGINKKQLYDVEYNVMIGGYILRHYYDKKHSWIEAIKAYYGRSKYAKIYANIVSKRLSQVRNVIQASYSKSNGGSID
jgi:hypothetical protein